MSHSLETELELRPSREGLKADGLTSPYYSADVLFCSRIPRREWMRLVDLLGVRLLTYHEGRKNAGNLTGQLTGLIGGYGTKDLY
jgi:hypothetical protein